MTEPRNLMDILNTSYPAGHAFDQDPGDGVALMSTAHPVQFIVCGWYTPDYAHLAEKLITCLDEYGYAHDFRAVDKLEGGWATNTRRKAEIIDQLMTKHPYTPLVLLDVDCEVRKPLDSLVLAVQDCDVAVHLRPDTQNQMLRPWSCTMVINPTDAARDMVRRWIDESAKLHRYDVDETSLAIAISKTPWLKLVALPLQYCSNPGQRHPNPVIEHDSEGARQESGCYAMWRRGYLMARGSALRLNGKARRVMRGARFL